MFYYSSVINHGKERNAVSHNDTDFPNHLLLWLIVTVEGPSSGKHWRT